LAVRRLQVQQVLAVVAVVVLDPLGIPAERRARVLAAAQLRGDAPDVKFVPAFDAQEAVPLRRSGFGGDAEIRDVDIGDIKIA